MALSRALCILLQTSAGGSGIGLLPAAAARWRGFSSTLWPTSEQKQRSRSQAEMVWNQVTSAAHGDPEKLKEVVSTLHAHCLETRSSPPLRALNDLLHCCGDLHDMESAHKLLDIITTNAVPVDQDTYRMLHRIYTYFPAPGSGFP